MPDATIESLQAEIEKMKKDSEKAVNALAEQNEQLMQDNEKLTAKHAEAEKHRKNKEKEAREAAEKAAQASGDVDAINNSWQEKYSALEQSKNDSESDLQKIINFQTVDTAAKQTAISLALDGCSPVIEPHIKSRLYSEIVDGKSVLKVKDKDGKPSAMTLDDLKTEISENKAFERVIKGSSASGGGPAGNGQHNGAKTISRKDFEQMSHLQRSEFSKNQGTVYD